MDTKRRGRLNVDKYSDIINMERPCSGRQRMDVADRAKIFMPFAALKGYDEMIETINQFVSSRNELYTKREVVHEYGDEV